MSASLNMSVLPSPMLGQDRPTIGDRLRAAGFGGGNSTKNSKNWNLDKARVMAKVFDVESYGRRNSKSKIASD